MKAKKVQEFNEKLFGKTLALKWIGHEGICTDRNIPVRIVTDASFKGFDEDEIDLKSYSVDILGCNSVIEAIFDADDYKQDGECSYSDLVNDIATFVREWSKRLSWIESEKDR